MKPSEATVDPQAGESTPDAIEGVVTRIVFRNDDTGYTVCAVRPANTKRQDGMDLFNRSKSRGAEEPASRDEITVVGNCAELWIGENLKAVGKWAHHRRHGRQFQAEHITCIAPATIEGIQLYLCSGVIKGIGKVTAERLVKAFGANTLHVLNSESARLCEVPGIGKKTREKIKTAWEAQKAVRDIMIFMRSHGIGAAQAVRIHKQYGADSVAVVTKNPYRLCQDVWGIGFKSADKIAMNIGIPPESEIRARAGILYTLQTMAEEGHCFCPREVLLEEGQALLGIPTEILDKAIQCEIDGENLVQEESGVYLSALHHAEVGIARSIRELMTAPAGFTTIDADKAVPWAEGRMQITFAPAQADALKMALTEKVSIITGGPGVGKTTIIRALVDVFTTRKLKVALAAPTGRAAKRLSEATQAKAMTIHRLLKFQPHTMSFEHGKDNPLEGDVFILDEVSMMDVSLTNHFVRALAPRSHVIFVGDSDQLPSVGPGNVLKDLIAADAIPCKRLDHIFRQQSRSWIVYNAHRVNNGESLELPDTNVLSDFYFLRVDEADEVIARMLELVTTRIPERFGLNPLTDVQVLTPMRKNQLGAENLNVLLQAKLNPSGDSLSRYGMIYRTGDRVMQIRNNYDKEVFNGDIGSIAAVNAADETVTVDFDGRPVQYGSTDLDELDLAYACSIHKAQGSEYPAVVILMATQHYRLLQRNLLYTAITRGRKLVCLIGSNKAVHIAIKNNNTLLRRTSLARRLWGPGTRVEMGE